MAKGNEIIISAHPRGVFMEGIISGALKPGIVMEIKPNTAPTSGRFTWQAAGAGGTTAGKNRLIAVLLPDQLQGKTATDAYVDGTRCFLYAPIAGEDLNMQVQEPGTGTGTTVNIGDRLEVAGDGSGQLVHETVSAPAATPFAACEQIKDISSTSSQLVWCKFLG